MNIGYDLLTWEGDILRLHFWAHAFEFLKKTGAVFLQTEGKLKGCWVMQIDDDRTGRREPPEARRRGESAPKPSDADEQREKVIVRSDGTVTYVGKDMALPAVEVRPARQGLPLSRLRRTASRRSGRRRRIPAPRRPAPRRSAARRWVCNVIDTRQSYLQKLLKQALAALGYQEQAAHSVHYSYEMVALSHATARELGYDTSEDAGSAVRRGLRPQGARRQGRRPARSADRQGGGGSRASATPSWRRTSRAASPETIAIAAVRYFMVKFSRGKVIVFDIDEALSFEGESGPYLQYAVVRANNIFNKLKERDGARRGRRVVGACRAPRRTPLDGGDDEAHDLWGLVLEAARLDEVVDQAVRTLELSVLAKYAFGLAQAFNGFYHRYPILNEERADVRLWRAAAVAYYRAQLTRALELMGCTVPAKM